MAVAQKRSSKADAEAEDRDERRRDGDTDHDADERDAEERGADERDDDERDDDEREIDERDSAEDEDEGDDDRTDRADAGRHDGDRSRRSGRGRRQPLVAVVRTASEQLRGLIRRPVETVSAVEPRDDGWLVQVEVVELERIPPSTDVLGSYELDVDAEGNLCGYQRVRRYYRNQAGDS